MEDIVEEILHDNEEYPNDNNHSLTHSNQSLKTVASQKFGFLDFVYAFTKQKPRIGYVEQFGF